MELRTALTPAPMERPLVRTLSELAIADPASVGRKGANLGELAAAGLPVPPAFVITTEAYRRAVQSAGLRETLAEAARELEPDDPHGVADAAALLHTRVAALAIPERVRARIRAAWQALGSGLRVAVRSSATIDDAAEASFAGMHASFTNVTDEASLYARIVDCWASLWDQRALAYRVAHRGEPGMDDEPALAVVVQVMVDADRSGVMFTVDPSSRSRDHLLIEAAYGLGAVVVGGQVEPDSYLVDKERVEPVRSHVGTKRERIVATATGERREDVGEAERSVPCLSRAEVRRVAELGLSVEELFGVPMDVEFAFEGGRLHVLQARPITSPGASGDEAQGPATRGVPLLTGVGVSHGRAAGRVRVLLDPAHGAKVGPGDIVVAPMTSPEWMPILQRAGGLITDAGGATSHAAIAARELGLPCVVATVRATVDLREGAIVTVDGSAGEIFRGDRVGHEPRALLHEEAPPLSELGAGTLGPRFDVASREAVGMILEPLATRMMVNLTLSGRTGSVVRAAGLPVDGVGLLRAEPLILAALGGNHPGPRLAAGRRAVVTDGLARAIESVAAAFDHRPVFYRAFDVPSTELRTLRGGETREPLEANPSLGYRGCFRALREPALFELELDALARVRERHPNVHLVLPFVRTTWELEEILERIDDHLGHDRKLQRWVAAEVPSAVCRLGEYAALGVDGVSVEGGALTERVLGVDRESTLCSELFDPTDPAVLWALGKIIRGAHRHDLDVSFVGSAPLAEAELVEHLVGLGVDGISVDPDGVPGARSAIAGAERRILLEGARGERAGRARGGNGGRRHRRGNGRSAH